MGQLLKLPQLREKSVSLFPVINSTLSASSGATAMDTPSAEREALAVAKLPAERVSKNNNYAPFHNSRVRRGVRIEAEARRLGLELVLAEVTWAYIEEYVWPDMCRRYNLHPNEIENKKSGDIERVGESGYRLSILNRYFADLEVSLIANSGGISLSCRLLSVYSLG